MSRALTENDPPSGATVVRSREEVRPRPTPDRRPPGLSSPRWPSGFPRETAACGIGRIPGAAVSPGSGRPRCRPGVPRKSRPCGRPKRRLSPRRRGNPGRSRNGASTRAPRTAPPPGIPGRCAAFPPSAAGTPPPAPGPSRTDARLLLAADRNGEPLPPFRAASGKNLPAGGGRHPLPESVGSQPPPVVGLVGALHRGATPSRDRFGSERRSLGKEIRYSVCSGRVNPDFAVAGGRSFNDPGSARSGRGRRFARPGGRAHKRSQDIARVPGKPRPDRLAPCPERPPEGFRRACEEAACRVENGKNSGGRKYP